MSHSQFRRRKAYTETCIPFSDVRVQNESSAGSQESCLCSESAMQNMFGRQPDARPEIDNCVLCPIREVGMRSCFGGVDPSRFLLLGGEVLPDGGKSLTCLDPRLIVVNCADRYADRPHGPSCSLSPSRHAHTPTLSGTRKVPRLI